MCVSTYGNSILTLALQMGLAPRSPGQPRRVGGVIVRTHFFDCAILAACGGFKEQHAWLPKSLSLEVIQQVVMLGAGLDARPWRLPLPDTVRWGLTVSVLLVAVLLLGAHADRCLLIWLMRDVAARRDLLGCAKADERLHWLSCSAASQCRKRDPLSAPQQSPVLSLSMQLVDECILCFCRWFEIDQAEVLRVKEKALKASGAPMRAADNEGATIPVNVAEVVPVVTDFEQPGWPSALRDAGFDSQQPVLWHAEGIFNYLTAATVERVLIEASQVSQPTVLLCWPRRQSAMSLPAQQICRRAPAH